MSNSRQALDLYARVEDLLGIEAAAPALYAHYLLALQSFAWESLLDVGCGAGTFVAQLSGAFPDARMEGIDLSPEMVRRARQNGVSARCTDLCGVTERYDVLTCVFDMLNYLSPEEITDFFVCVRRRLGPGGVLLCDLNTPYGFEEVAVGAFTAEDEQRFLAIDSEYDAGVYTAGFTLFEREGECWSKETRTLRQYWHDPEVLAQKGGLELLERRPLSLYGEEADKEFLIYRLRETSSLRRP